MSSDNLRILVIGAHPDDCEWVAGGITARYTRLGHHVKLVSLSNGDAGHLEMSGAPLARRRRDEAAAAAKALGAESLVLDHHDGTLLPTLELRSEVIQIIREYKPDLVMSHRPNDYHPDHRYTGVVVQDAINMVIVGNLVPYAPALHYIPVMVYLWDHFQKPYPFIPDILVDIDEVYEQKIDGLHCHTSQMYEFLFGKADVEPDKRREWLKKKVEADMAAPTRLYRHKLAEIFDNPRSKALALQRAEGNPRTSEGKEKSEQIHYVEAFEVCEYGGKLTPEGKRRLFPFD
jgi:N-acetylglucosamine malate deacetylase 1